jgi:uncharacterized membrane protein (Fun14 family)
MDMSDEAFNREIGRLMAIATVGSEMAAPIGLGFLIDYWLGWTPALTVCGAVLGLVGGIYHLIVLNRKSPR